MCVSFFIATQLFYGGWNFFDFETVFKPPKTDSMQVCLRFIWCKIYLFIECFGRGFFYSYIFHSFTTHSILHRAQIFRQITRIRFCSDVVYYILYFLSLSHVHRLWVFGHFVRKIFSIHFVCLLVRHWFFIRFVIGTNFYWLQTALKLSFSQLFLNQ